GSIPVGGARLASGQGPRKGKPCALHKSAARATLVLRKRAQIVTERVDNVASMGLNLDEQKAVDRFRQQVVEPSRDKLVVLDFWAEWCGPCKALTPVLEKVAADYADKGVLLAKLNVDEEQFIAAQFQVRSIPPVYATFQG